MHNNEKRALILSNASRLFSQKGYFGVGINEILAACEIPKGSFYHYFPQGKNQLAVEVMIDAYERMERWISEYLFAQSEDAVEIFSQMAEHLAMQIDEHVEGLSSLTITFMGIEARYISKEMATVSDEIYHRWELLYRDKLLQCGHVEGLSSLTITFMGIEARYISKEMATVSDEIYHRWELLYRDKLLQCGYEKNEAEKYAKMLLTLIHGNLISCWISGDSINLRNVKEMLPTLLPR